MTTEAFYPKVEFVSREAIENNAAMLIRNYCIERNLKEVPIPIPIEDIAKYVGYEITFDDLDAVIGVGTLAAIDFENNYIMIDEKLVPENGGNKGRYSYSIAHEIGHHRFHKHLIKKPNLDLFDDKPTDNKLFCRNTENPLAQQKPSIEIQADMFAASLLMPAQLVKNMAREFKNFETMYNESDRLKMIRTISDTMATSREASEYRLVDLKIIPSKEQISDWEINGNITLLVS